MNFYQDNAQAYIKSSFATDVSFLYPKFERYLVAGDPVLDIGCGAGRDLKHFAEKFEAMGLEPCAPFAEHARRHSGCKVVQESVENYQPPHKFKGLWACASLLHIPKMNLPNVFRRLSSWLVPGGVLFCCFKHGDFDGARDGRHFTDLNRETLLKILEGQDFRIEEIWVTKDANFERQIDWLNVILVRNQ